MQDRPVLCQLRIRPEIGEDAEAGGAYFQSHTWSKHPGVKQASSYQPLRSVYGEHRPLSFSYFMYRPSRPILLPSLNLLMNITWNWETARHRFGFGRALRLIETYRPCSSPYSDCCLQNRPYQLYMCETCPSCTKPQSRSNVNLSDGFCSCRTAKCGVDSSRLYGSINRGYCVLMIKNKAREIGSERKIEFSFTYRRESRRRIARRGTEPRAFVSANQSIPT